MVSGEQTAYTAAIGIGNTPVRGEPLYPERGRNYIKKKVYLTENPYNEETDDAIPTITYYDGLGRPLQSIVVMGTPGLLNLVTPFEYDAMGRQTEQYLPFAIDTDWRNDEEFGAYFDNALADQRAFYASRYAENNDGRYAYLRTEYENSPLGRPVREWGAGAKRSAVAATHSYAVNTAEEVPFIWLNTAGIQLTEGYYPAGSLYKYQYKDPDNRTVTRYTDKDGRTVMEAQGEFRTCFVYDDFGQMRYVVSPAGVESLSPGNSYPDGYTILQQYAYAYLYDAKGRITDKRLPGSQTEYYIYDANDRVVMSQDGNQRTKSQWKLFRYDGVGRVINEWLVTTTASRTTLQTTYEDLYDNTQRKTTLRTCRYGGYGYDGLYDPRYTFVPEEEIDFDKRGILTSETVFILDDVGTPVVRNYYYDGENRIRLKVEYIDDMFHTTEIHYSYDYDFRGQVIREREHHMNRGEIVDKTHSYDSRGNLMKTAVEYKDKKVELYYSYDHMGRLAARRIGDFEHIERYDHNISGLLTSHASPLFQYRLRYEYPAYGKAQLGGNISEVEWKHSNDDRSLYVYSYDSGNRLLDAQYYTHSSGDIFNATDRYRESLTYDVNGNILTLSRTDGSGNLSDELAYGYAGNKLVTLSGTSAGTFGYDQNGNLSTDPVNALKFEYNSLNLVNVVRNSSNDHVASFAYTPDGRKHRYREGSGMYGDNSDRSGREYLGNFTYTVNGGAMILEGYHFGDGVIAPDGVRYYEKDHLGNVRVVFTSEGEVLERNDYYAFGQRHTNARTPVSADNRYRYNGKERVATGSLDLYDFGARMYDPRLGRWFVNDPRSEKYYGFSSYSYTLNNPVNAVDPDGKIVIFINGNHFGDGGKSEYWLGMDKIAMEALNDSKALYFDGSMGGGMIKYLIVYISDLRLEAILQAV